MEINVDGAYRRTKAPNILDSGGFGPCFVVGALYERNAYMLHDVWQNSLITYLSNMIKDLKADVKDRSRLNIDIAGAELLDFEGVSESQIMGRDYVLEQFKEAGLFNSVRRIRWAKTDELLQMRIIPGKGRMTLDSTFMEYDGLVTPFSSF
jgi:hypothetical protein